MASLSEDLFHVKVKVLDDLSSRVLDLVEHLSKGLPVLVPYDCDKNHDPIVKNGKTAHWATLLGFAIEFTQQMNIGNEKITNNIVHMSPPLDENTLKSICSSIKSGIKVLLFAKQGKSKFMRLWTFDELSTSNQNLRLTNNTFNIEKEDEVEEKGSYLQVEGDLSQSLAKKAVFLGSLQ